VLINLEKDTSIFYSVATTSSHTSIIILTSPFFSLPNDKHYLFTDAVIKDVSLVPLMERR
jgi:hypothetical protein